MERNERYSDMGTFLIYIDSYEKGVPAGEYSSPCTGEQRKFQSLTQLLLEMDQKQEKKSGSAAPVSLRLRCGRIATFAVHICFRRNCSWQGSLRWLEGNEKQRFRSVLELVYLMNSALE